MIMFINELINNKEYLGQIFGSNYYNDDNDWEIFML